MEFDEFERELHESLRHQPAPTSLKRKVMDRRDARRPAPVAGARHQHSRMIWFERIAASVVLAGVAGSAAVGHYAVERRKGEEAKQQVFTALRITNHAFQVMNAQFEQQDRVSHDQDSQ